jgi:hypothetical protein
VAGGLLVRPDFIGPDAGILAMRYDEELCRDALSRLLRQRGLNDSWSEGTEPPDWFLEVAGQRFAVEVTSIHGVTSFDGQERNWTQISHELTPFAQNVCDEVQSIVTIPGVFFVDFSPIPNLKSHKQEIVQALVEYFRGYSPGRDAAESRVIARFQVGEVAVYRSSGVGNALVAGALLAGSRVSRLTDQLTDILPDAVRKKVSKMKAISEPVILVILDQYGFQRAIGEWRSRLPAEVSRFEAVVRVRGESAELIYGDLPFG